MSFIVTFRVPVSAAALLVSNYGTPAADPAHVKAEIKSALIFAIENTLPMSETAIIAGTPTERINLSLPASYTKYIDELSLASGLDESYVCQRLVIAASEIQTPSSIRMPEIKGVLGEVLKACPTLNERPEQIQSFENLCVAMDGRHISLMEAGTGTGKTLAILAAAETVLRKNATGRVVISVPTIALMRQFASNHDEWFQRGVFKHSLRCIVGRREFVSIQDIQNLAAEAKYVEYREAIDAWIEKGGLPSANAGVKQNWLVYSLKEIVPNFPVEACWLSDVPEEGDPGLEAYRAQFDSDDYPRCEVVICTHAMLSVSTRVRKFAAHRDEDYSAMQRLENGVMESIRSATSQEEKKLLTKQLKAAQTARLAFGAEISENRGVLPSFSHLIVDEGHLLESSMSTTNSNCIPLNSIVHLLKQANELGAGISKEKISRVKQSLIGIQQLSLREDIALDGADRCSQEAIMHLREITDSCVIGRGGKKSTQISNCLFRLKYIKGVLQAAIASQSQRALIQFSPVREFPRLLVGAVTVKNMLAALWASVESAAIVSATLYLKTNAGYSGGYMRQLLNIPESRALEQTPVIPPWLYSTVKGVWVPPAEKYDSNGYTWLRPPTRSDRLSPENHSAAEAHWIADVATAIEGIYASAQGGVLVLMSSYDSVKKLAKLLPADFHKFMIVASQDETVTGQSHGYMRLANAGHKPIWLATGAAWTGLDVGGHTPWEGLFGTQLAPGDDLVITDLVIPRIPFGLNKSLTHTHRLETQNVVPWEILDTMFRLRQGLVRLVRRENLPQNRRIFILDYRIHDAKMGGMRRYIDNIVQPYHKLTDVSIKALRGK